MRYGELLGSFVVAVVVSFLLMRTCQWVLRRMRVERKTAVVLSAILVLIFALATVDFQVALMAYVPALALWLVVDLLSARKLVSGRR